MIEVKNLVKKFGNINAVDNISFNVKRGEIFAFLGPNGAGKTTTIKILTTLLVPTSGEIRINGFLTNNQKDEVRRSFGIVFQDESLDEELTDYEIWNFMLFYMEVKRKFMIKKNEELLKLVELWGKKDDLV
jgi:ABC-2 type transport system ATP-binding protein